LAPIFAAVYFFNPAKILPFSIQSSRNKQGHMTTKAMAHLHRKRLMDLLTPCKEVFIWFVVLLDIMHYHPYSFVPLLEKCGILFSVQDTDAVFEFIDTYTRNMESKRFNSIHSCTAGPSRDTVLRISFYSWLSRNKS
jgi:hypothetical protein